MKLKLKSALAGVATMAVSGVTLIGLAGAANAAGGTPPPYNPDPNAVGNLVFYDASGNVLTGGTNLNHLFDYAAATGPGDSGAIKATMYFAVPNHSLPTTSWAKQQASGSYAYPNSAAPAPLTGPGFSNPLVSLISSDGNLNNVVVGGAFNLDSTAGYANIIQVRVVDNLGNATTKYFATDIAYNPSSATAPVTTDGVTVAPGSWAVVNPNVTTTTSALTANPPSPQNTAQGATAGSNVTLTDTITPSAAGNVAGTVQFFEGTTALGSPVTVTSNAAQFTVTAPTFGSHSYSAVFTPTGGTPVQGSSAPAIAYQVNAPATPTTTSLSGPASASQYGAVSYTATETPVPSPDGGTFTFTATGTGTTTGTSTLGTATEAAGTGTLSISSLTLPAGTYNVTATFAPTSSSYASSTSQPVALTVSKPACPGAPDPSGATCSDTQNIQVTINPGSLTITTPYTSAHPYVLGAMQLTPDAKSLTSGNNTFPAAGDPQIAVHDSLAGNQNWTVSVTDSDLTCVSGNCFTSPNANEYQKINGENLGLTAGGSDAPNANFPGTVNFTAIPADSTVVAPSDGGSNGLKGGPHTFATSAGPGGTGLGGNGTVNLHGTLTLNAPTATQDGTYAGTITFTVG